MVCSLHPTTAAAESGLSYQGTAADISQQLAFSTPGSNQEYDLCLHTYPLCRLLCAVSKCNCYRMDGYRETLQQLMQVHIAKVLRVCSGLQKGSVSFQVSPIETEIQYYCLHRNGPQYIGQKQIYAQNIMWEFISIDLR